jgi:AcrR family transcriptional regulator
VNKKKRAGTNITEAKIVEAAVQLFSRQGFKATSTRDIADLAQVNEVTLFRYFPQKSKLFSAAAESRLGRVRMSRELQQKLATDAAISETVPMLTEFFLGNFCDPPDLARLLYVASFEVLGANRLIREHLGPHFDAIRAYFERCAAKGHIRNVDSALATVSLAGMASAHQNYLWLFAENDKEWNATEVASSYSEFLLRALRCTPTETTSTDS